MFGKVDLKTALFNQRDRGSSSFLDSVKSILNTEAAESQRVQDRLGNKSIFVSRSDADFSSQIFQIEDIRKVCIRFHLRFLDSKLYVGEIPMQAVERIKKLERTTHFDSFKIMAPKELFELEDENADPLLFGQLADGSYELIAQWGNDLSGLRALKSYPRRNMLTLTGTIALIILSVILITANLTALEAYFSADSGINRLFFFFLSIILVATSSFWWVASNQRFSSEAWNSRSF
jgi:hypothetical protein